MRKSSLAHALRRNPLANAQFEVLRVYCVLLYYLAMASPCISQLDHDDYIKNIGNDNILYPFNHKLNIPPTYL